MTTKRKVLIVGGYFALMVTLFSISSRETADFKILLGLMLLLCASYFIVRFIIKTKIAPKKIEAFQMSLKETLKNNFTIVLWVKKILIFIVILLGLKWAITEGVRVGVGGVVSQLSYSDYDKIDRLKAVLKETKGLEGMRLNGKLRELKRDGLLNRETFDRYLEHESRK